jgi:hypothetical protein
MGRNIRARCLMARRMAGVAGGGLSSAFANAI